MKIKVSEEKTRAISARTEPGKYQPVKEHPLRKGA
jgi:hypothetical protein